jgi:nitrogenase-associated protein
MATIVFYEKPGCATNARQRKVLQQAGHTVDQRSLLSEAWTKNRLRQFFGTLPVAQWFNKAAPKIKSGVINPEAIDAEIALEIFIQEPLLIRRPLIEVNGQQFVGFDEAKLKEHISLPNASDELLEGCSRQNADAPTCPTPTSNLRSST